MRQNQLDVWPFLKSPAWNQIEGGGNFQTAKPYLPIGTDNNFQHKGIDSTGNGPSDGNVCNSYKESGALGRFVLNNPNGTVVGDAAVAPTAPVVVANTVGAVTWSYAVVYRYASTATTAASSNGSTTTGVATLSATAVNTISGVAPEGAAYVDLYRTVAGTTPNTTGLIATISCNTLSASGAWSIDDTGLAADGTTAPSTDTTGVLDIADGAWDFVVNSLSLPVILSATVNGTAGSTSYGYEVAAVTRAGNQAVSAVTTATTGNATLTSVNSITIKWKSVPGALSYKVYRTSSAGTPSTTGLIGTVAAVVSVTPTLSFIDTGIAATGTAPVASSNTTGAISAASGVVGSSQQATVNLSAANIIAANGAPVSVISAPGAGKAIVVQQILFEMTTTSTGFTGGGVSSFVYHGGSVPVHAGSVPAGVVTAGAGTSYTLLGPAVAANGTTVTANVGVDYSVATAPFAAGTGTAKVQIWYNVVTL